MRRSHTVNTFKKKQEEFDTMVSELRKSKNDYNDVKKSEIRKRVKVNKHNSRQGFNQKESPDWMKFENYYNHDTPWKRPLAFRDEFHRTPYYKTGDERLSVMFREVHLLPRSYKIPKDKPPFLSPKKGSYEFPKPNEKYMTRIGKMMLKHKRRETEVLKRNHNTLTAKSVANALPKRPRWNFDALPKNKTSKHTLFVRYRADKADVKSERDRYQMLKSYKTIDDMTRT